MTASLPDWATPPANLQLNSDEVHVWLADLNLPPLSIQRLQQTLSEDEQARAERFHFVKDQNHFVAARGILRSILSGYLGLSPAVIRFCYGSGGKPALAPDQGGEKLRFNLSHSQGLALYAVTQNREIGIDLEQIRRDFAYENIAKGFFSACENAVLQQLPTSHKARAFFNCWTRKEAYIKATGQGLSIPLDQFDVSLAPGEPAQLLKTQWDDQEPLRWSLKEIPVTPEYAAALAVSGSGWQLQCWRWFMES